MPAILLFFASLSGIIILVLFKTYELSRGVKPFSTHRYKLDAVLRDKTERVYTFVRYFNRETIKLLFLFLLSELKDIAVVLLRKIEDTKIGETVRGRNIPKGNGNGTNSAFLRGMSEMKEAPRDEDK